MKKILFFVLLSFCVTQNSLAAEDTIFTSEEACMQAGGEGALGCNLRTSTCGDVGEKIGTCKWDGWIDNSSACCKKKENGGQTVNGVTTGGNDEHSLNVIGTNKCTASKSQGGWGGRCAGSLTERYNPTNDEDLCNDSGNDAEDFVGLCNVQSTFTTRTDCCVPKGTGLENPDSGKYETKIISESTCGRPYNANGSGYGGKCEDIDDTSWDPTGGFIDGKDPVCDTEGEVMVALCQEEGVLGMIGAGDSMNGCCVPKEGDYCQKLKKDTGNDVCTTMGAGGAATPLEYGDYILLEQIPGSTNTSGKLQPYLESIYKAGFVLIVLGAIFMIGLGGFTYMSSAGNTSMIKKGKGMITDAIIGLVVALTIWLILNIINPDLVNPRIDPLPGVDFDPGDRGAAEAGSVAGGEVTSNLSAQDAAKKLLEHDNVTLSNSSSCGSNAGAKANLEQIARGEGMVRCACGGGGTVAPHVPMLNALVSLADGGQKFNINFLAGGCHSATSWHYKGRAVDMDTSNGSARLRAVNFFKSAGAQESFCDKGGKSVNCGAASHVHAAWEN